MSAVPRASARQRWRIIAEVLRTQPRTVLAGIVAGELIGIAASALLPYMLKRTVDGVTSGDEQRALVAAILLGLAAAAMDAGTRAAKDLRLYFSQSSGAYLATRIVRTVAGFPTLEHLERADLRDQVQILSTRGGGTVARAIGDAARASRVVIGLVISVVLLASVDVRLIAFPLFVLPSLAIIPKAQALRRAATEEAASLQRTAAHLQSLFADANAATEIRVFGAARVLDREADAYWKRAVAIETRGELRAAAWTALGLAVLALGYVGSLVLVTTSGLGVAAAGSLLMVVNITSRMRWQLEEAVGLGTAFKGSFEMLDRLVWLDAHEPQGHRGATAAVPARIERALTLRDVTFRYPGTESVVLTGVDLVVPAGTTMAIVGDNGAGKTTLVKLLCGFYRPASGQILIDDTDLATVDVTAWQRSVTAAFQDHLRLEDTFRESVAPAQGAPDAAVEVAARRGEALEMTTVWPARFETHLGKTYRDGEQLSGGQWQRVAVARAMTRSSALLLLLDEPTAALDPEAEHRLHEHYTAAARRAREERGAITVLISHRFATVRMADLIAVLADGRVVESGTHDALMALNGTYARLYRRQADAYA